MAASAEAGCHVVTVGAGGLPAPTDWQCAGSAHAGSPLRGSGSGSLMRGGHRPTPARESARDSARPACGVVLRHRVIRLSLACSWICGSLYMWPTARSSAGAERPDTSVNGRNTVGNRLKGATNDAPFEVLRMLLAPCLAVSPPLAGVRGRSPPGRRPAIGRWPPSVGASHPARPVSGPGRVSWRAPFQCERSRRSANCLWDRSHEGAYRASAGKVLAECRWGVQRNDFGCKNASQVVS